MSDRKELDFKAIEEWALAHGFVKTPDNNLVAHHQNVQVEIEFLKRSIRVTEGQGNHRRRLITAHPKRLHIDDHDMLQGAGLFSRFYTLYRDQYREGCADAGLPVWFGEKMRAMVDAHIAREEGERQPVSRRNQPLFP